MAKKSVRKGNEETNEFLKKLEKTKGIGTKTAKEIQKIYPTEEKLIEALSKGKADFLKANAKRALVENFLPIKKAMTDLSSKFDNLAKKVSKKKRATSSGKIIYKETSLNDRLVENFVSLQKVMTNLSIKFDLLSNKISNLLELFELSANALAKKEINITKPVDEKKILEQLENILTQNKIIARGLTLVHERISGQEESEEYTPTPTETQLGGQKPATLNQQQKQTPALKVPSPHSGEGYQKSPFPKEF